MDLLQSGGREKIAARNGNLLHAVFAGMAPARACALHGFSADATRVADCEAAYRDFCSHPLIRESTCQQCEVKFVHRFGGDVQVRGGAIDRIVRRPDGRYVVIDYKTEADPRDGPCRDEHLIQLSIYADAVRALTGSLPDTCLYYTGPGEWCRSPPISLRPERQRLRRNRTGEIPGAGRRAAHRKTDRIKFFYFQWVDQQARTTAQHIISNA
ncbi:PD-(D/E)XK nuclease family protein [Methanogenium cariaci]|uniref:PD-(D/E)XK nuclease family protein n=1 Tax=Methanogenium cariaci TaxID=2197 RepID=UPI0012F6D125|nr:PD-(D/E)XK nuclease family protein [Methanogenium cariaci]